MTGAPSVMPTAPAAPSAATRGRRWGWCAAAPGGRRPRPAVGGLLSGVVTAAGLLLTPVVPAAALGPSPHGPVARATLVTPTARHPLAAGAGAVGPLVMGNGYALVDATGVVSTFGGAAYLGDDYNQSQAAPVVAAAATADGRGYLLAQRAGGVDAFGDARFAGSLSGRTLERPIVGMALDPASGGYWLVAADGGVFAFGGAPFWGSLGGRPLDAPIVGMAADPVSGGYRLVAADGGVFTFGGATFSGSLGGRALAAPIVGMATDPTTGGYWLVAADGGVFAFGGAPFWGSLGGRPLAAPISALLPTPDGAGYRLVARDGGVFSFGDAPFAGSASDPLHPPFYPPDLSEDPPPTVTALDLAPGPQPASDGPIRVSITGDSLSFETAFGFAHVESTYGAWIANAGMPGCGLELPGTTMVEMWADPTTQSAPQPACAQWAQRDGADLARSHPDAVALLDGFWECQRWDIDGSWVDLHDANYADAVEAQLAQFAIMVRAAGAVPVYVTTPYFGDGTPPSLVDTYNALVLEAARNAGATVVDLHSLLDPDRAYAGTVDGVVARTADGVHLTFDGVVQLLAPALLPGIVTAGAAARI